MATNNDENETQNSGSSGSSGTGDSSGETTPDLEGVVEEKLESIMPQEALEAFRDQLGQTGDEERFAEMLYNENQSLREERRQLKQEKARLQKEGPEGKAVLDPEVADEIEHRLPEGKGVEDLPEFLDKAYDAIEELSRRKKTDRLKEAADVAGVNSSALEDLEPTAEYSVTEIEDEESGETKKQATITVDGEERPLQEYLTETYPAFKSVLFGGEGEGEAEGDETPSVPGPDSDSGDDVDASEDGEGIEDWIESQNFAVPEPEDEEGDVGSPL